MHDMDTPPKGPVFFLPGASRAYRLRRLLFLGVLMTASVALIWPVYALVAQPLPLVLGLPMPLAWIVAWLLIIMGALVWLYRSE